MAINPVTAPTAIPPASEASSHRGTKRERPSSLAPSPRPNKFQAKFHLQAPSLATSKCPTLPISLIKQILAMVHIDTDRTHPLDSVALMPSLSLDSNYIEMHGRGAVLDARIARQNERKKALPKTAICGSFYREIINNHKIIIEWILDIEKTLHAIDNHLPTSDYSLSDTENQLNDLLSLIPSETSVCRPDLRRRYPPLLTKQEAKDLITLYHEAVDCYSEANETSPPSDSSIVAEEPTSIAATPFVVKNLSPTKKFHLLMQRLAPCEKLRIKSKYHGAFQVYSIKNVVQAYKNFIVEEELNFKRIVSFTCENINSQIRDIQLEILSNGIMDEETIATYEEDVRLLQEDLHSLQSLNNSSEYVNWIKSNPIKAISSFGTIQEELGVEISISDIELTLFPREFLSSFPQNDVENGINIRDSLGLNCPLSYLVSAQMNELETVYPSTFNNPLATELSLFGNNFSRFPVEITPILPRIKFLDLSNTLIHNLRAGMIPKTGVQNLELYLANNQLYNVPNGVFDNLAIHTLSLSNCSISTLGSKAFNNSRVSNDGKLYLNNNKITELVESTFAGCSAGALNLNKNPISSLPQMVFPSDRDVLGISMLDCPITKPKPSSSETFDLQDYRNSSSL